MAQTLNIKGFIAEIDIEPAEFMLPLIEVIDNSIQPIEDKTHNEQVKFRLRLLERNRFHWMVILKHHIYLLKALKSMIMELVLSMKDFKLLMI